jgi:hypothetical protein
VTREEALKQLTSDSAHERLMAARFLARNSDLDNVPALRDARKSETVSYVKEALDRALARSFEHPADEVAPGVEDIAVPEEARKRIRAQAIDWITGFVLHEVASLTGLIARAASQEIRYYEASKTRQHIQTLQRIFPAIEQLKGATNAPSTRNSTSQSCS